MAPPLRKKVRPAPPAAPGPDPSAWTEAKVKAVLDSFRSFLANASKKHGVSASEVLDLVRDHVMDPD